MENLEDYFNAEDITIKRLDKSCPLAEFHIIDHEEFSFLKYNKALDDLEDDESI
jgi:hypothetical protein